MWRLIYNFQSEDSLSIHGHFFRFLCPMEDWNIGYFVGNKLLEDQFCHQYSCTIIMYCNIWIVMAINHTPGEKLIYFKLWPAAYNGSYTLVRTNLIRPSTHSVHLSCKTSAQNYANVNINEKMLLKYFPYQMDHHHQSHWVSCIL